jgi:hypothetical protein
LPDEFHLKSHLEKSEPDADAFKLSIEISFKLLHRNIFQTFH